jgi:PAS domain S-box-containing protein
MDLAQLVSWEFDVNRRIFRFDGRFSLLYRCGTTQENHGKMSDYEYVREFVHADDIELVRENIRHALSSANSQSTGQFEHRIVRKEDYEVRHVLVRYEVLRDTFGKAVRILGANQDITDRKRIEVALQKSEEKYSKLFMLSPDPICLSRISDSLVIEANESFCKAMGVSPQAILEHSVLVADYWLVPEERQNFIDFLIVKGEASGYETSFKRENGSIWKGIVSSRLVDFFGVPYVLSVIQDITDRVALEERLNAALAEKEALLSELQHRVKNSFSIVASLFSIGRAEIKDERASAVLLDAEERVRAIGSIYDRLKVSSSIKYVDLRPYVTDLARSLVETYSASAGTVKLELELEDLRLARKSHEKGTRDPVSIV